MFKVHYLDHSKTYVAPASAATAVDSETLQYSAYLSTMPEGIEEEAAGIGHQAGEGGKIRVKYVVVGNM